MEKTIPWEQLSNYFGYKVPLDVILIFFFIIVMAFSMSSRYFRKLSKRNDDYNQYLIRESKELYDRLKEEKNQLQERINELENKFSRIEDELIRKLGGGS